MATIYNTDVTKGLAKDAGLQLNRDAVPNQLAEKIVPVMETNPKLLRRINFIRNDAKTASAANTLFTTNANQDFYVCGFQIGIAKDAACDCTDIIMRSTIEGSLRYFCDIPLVVGILDEVNYNFIFPQPIKLDRNVAVQFVASWTAGTARLGYSIWGYYDESGA